MAEVEIRDAVAADADAIARIHFEGWTTGYRGLLPDDHLDGLVPDGAIRRWRGQLAMPTRSTHERVAVLDGEVVGFATSGSCVDPDSPRGKPWGEVWDCFVADGMRGQGIGSRLLATVLADLDGHHDEVVLWVLQGNERAVATYARAGFVADGMRRSQDMGGFEMVDFRMRLAR